MSPLKTFATVFAVVMGVAFLGLTFGATYDDRGHYQGLLLALLAGMIGAGFTYAFVMLIWGADK